MKHLLLSYITRFLNVLKCFRRVEEEEEEVEVEEVEVDEQSSNSITVFCSCAIMSISHFI